MRKYSEYNKSEPLLFHLQISSQKALPDKTLKVPLESQSSAKHSLNCTVLDLKNYSSIIMFHNFTLRTASLNNKYRKLIPLYCLDYYENIL